MHTSPISGSGCVRIKDHPSNEISERHLVKTKIKKHKVFTFSVIFLKIKTLCFFCYLCPYVPFLQNVLSDDDIDDLVGDYDDLADGVTFKPFGRAFMLESHALHLFLGGVGGHLHVETCLAVE